MSEAGAVAVAPVGAGSAPASRRVAYRGDVLVPSSNRVLGALGLVGLIGLWQVASAAGWISPIFVPSPAEVARSLGGMALSGELAGHLRASLARLGLGYALGASVGVGFGLAAGLFTLLRAPGLALVAALFPVPKIALLPLFILWFGIGEGAKVATIAFGAFFPTVVATVGAVDGVDRGLVRMARSFGLGAGAIVRKVILPGALPGILAGLRIASSIAIVLLVAAEMIGADEGIGSLVLAAGNLMQTDRLLAGVVVLSGIGLLMAGAFGLAERRLLAWR